MIRRLIRWLRRDATLTHTSRMGDEIVKGDIICVSGERSEEHFVVVSVDSPTTMTIGKVPWWRRLVWWLRRIIWRRR